MIWNFEKPINNMDEILSYEKGTENREKLIQEINTIKQKPIEIPLIINGEEIHTENVIDIPCPHDHSLVLAKAHLASEKELKQAMKAALSAH